ncbi:TetR/AcrR family transcriptional regulator [Nocardioides mangrovi]|uniref:TetR/AcrR family transcriptional regulator n=1 Tax=Nocardioides mangrovi TaxID=2874580 RepID=A0ABS7UCA8_9ACTN|nr:TetR/AcrR family transcriptional regulator [Nocardioides mangrovi]MBZ5738611.1 TetR/AcrR family transcriptional regulator [Nocardioides mangrovi]
MTKSERTRNALREVALRHFVADGFEAASVPAIAAEVGVTERTFYRHFATKDEVLFGDVATRLEWFGSALRARPAEEDLVRSVLAALGAAPTDPQLLAEIARLRVELLSAARIERVFRDRQGAMATELRALLVDRGSDPLAAAVRAEAVAGAVFAALAVWTEAPPPHDLGRLGELTETALEQVRPVLSPPGTEPGSAQG